MTNKPKSNNKKPLIYIGADHGGFQFKEELKLWLEQFASEVIDCGAHVHDPKDDYPLFAAEVAKKVASSVDSLGVLLCRSGGGMTIAANKIDGIRAVEVFDDASASHAREHNHANVVTLGGDYLTLNQVKSALKSYLLTTPSSEERHLRRIQQIHQLEQKNS
jgi:ribose 5-phosphate isomerase B